MEIPPRPAATVMLVRDGPAGDAPLEVLMVRRSLKSEFVSGAHVFPGGAVDDEDGAAAGFTTGPDDDAASALLGLESGGLAYWVAALRESFEEAGILLAYRADGSLLSFEDPEEEQRFVEHRRAMNARELSLAELYRREAITLACDRLVYFAHWITPAGQPRRYDTRFFVAPAPPGQRPVHDAAETIVSMWIRPNDAVARFEAGDFELVLPTLRNLAAIGRFATSDELFVDVHRGAEVLTVAPRVLHDEHGSRLVIPGDTGDEIVNMAEHGG